MEQADVEPEIQNPVNNKSLRKAKKRKNCLQVEDLEMQMLRDEMINETNIITKIVKERSQKWVTMCQQQNDPHLRDAVHTIWKAFERANDSKDALIKELVNTLNRERELSVTNFQETEHEMENMVSEFNRSAKRKKARMQYNMRLYNDDRVITGNRLIEEHRARVEYLKEIEYYELHNESKNHTLKTEELLRNKSRILKRHFTEKEVWGEKKKAALKKIWNNYKTTVHDYRLKESLMNAKTKEIAVKVSKSDNIIQNQENQIARMTEKVNKLRKNLEEERQSLALSDLRADRTQLQNRRRRLNARWRKKKIAADESLKNLTWNALQTIRRLETIHEKGERILRLRMECKKLQTSEEQNGPLARNRRESYYSQTMSIWQAYKRAEIMCKTMQTQKEFLLAKNREMESSVNKYLCEIGSSISKEQRNVI